MCTAIIKRIRNARATAVYYCILSQSGLLYLMRLLTILFPSRNLRHTLQSTPSSILAYISQGNSRDGCESCGLVGSSFRYGIHFTLRTLAFNFILYRAETIVTWGQHLI